MTRFRTSAILAPLILTGYMTADEADACRNAMLGQIIPELPSEFASLIDDTINRLRAIELEGESTP